MLERNQDRVGKIDHEEYVISGALAKILKMLLIKPSPSRVRKANQNLVSQKQRVFNQNFHTKTQTFNNFKLFLVLSLTNQFLGQH